MIKVETSFESLVEQLELLNVLGEAGKAFLEAIAHAYGLSHVAYLGLQLPMADKNMPCGAVTYPADWVARYVEQDYFAVDPVVAETFKSILPLDWSTLNMDTKAAKKIFGEAKQFGITNQGLSYPIRGRHGDKAIFSVVGEANSRHWALFKKQHMAEFNILGYYIHQRVLNSVCRTTTPVSLSPREQACLQWAARGKTMEDIGTILGISNNTVRMYLDSSRHKFNCLNITHAVATAIKLELISPP